MSVEPDDPRLIYMPEADVLKANGPVFAYHDYWWSVHPEKGLIFYTTNTKRPDIARSHPQCNSNGALTSDLLKRLYPWAVAKHYPLVLVPIKAGDY
jgi:hypothetical protein